VDKKNQISKPIKLQVSVTQEMGEWIDKMCQLFGQNRSAMVCYFIGQAMLGYTSMGDTLHGIVEQKLREEEAKIED
jgi:hypothetical protein